MRMLLMVLWLLAAGAGSAMAGVQVSIGINLPIYPQLVPVPGYPVYYAPAVAGNFFFYDGLYWVYYGDDWYVSSWYNGPWTVVSPIAVPLFILRVPVRYYRDPPIYFREWRVDAPPRWHEHWGHEWTERRRGWDRWDRGAAPPPAPLPTYQREYSGDRYPREIREQQELSARHYRYRPREAVARDVVPAPKSREPDRGRDRDRDRQEIEAAPPQRAPRMAEEEDRHEQRNRQEQRERHEQRPERRQSESMPMEPRQAAPRQMEPRHDREMRERQTAGPRVEDRQPQGQQGGGQSQGRKRGQEEERGKDGR